VRKEARMTKRWARISLSGVWTAVFAAAASLLAVVAMTGCNALYGLGTDLQTMSDYAQTNLVVDNPAND